MQVIRCTSLSPGLSTRIFKSNTHFRPLQRSMSFSSPSLAPPLTPRPSASLVIINERNEILLVRRNPKATAFGGIHVFPGGNFDGKQDKSLAMTAIRETFEESGLLLASSSPSSAPLLLEEGAVVLEEARNEIHQQKLLFQDFLQSNNLEANVGSLYPFTQWITPVGQPRRFHTQFYVAFLPAIPSSGFSSGVKQERIPKHDGGQEVIEARFVHPRTALIEFREGRLNLMPPQYYILSTLADILQGSTNTLTEREKVQILSRGSFGKMVMTPQRYKNLKEDGKDCVIITLEGDETRGGSDGRLHRVLVKITSDGAISEIVVKRNFDIFSEIEPQRFPKL